MSLRMELKQLFTFFPLQFIHYQARQISTHSVDLLDL